MKTSSSSISARRVGQGQSLSQKLLVVSIMVAMLFASFPAGVALATPASLDSRSVLRGEWKDKIQNVQVESFFYDRVRIYPADFKDPNELAKAHEFLNNYGVALRAAGTLILNHVGFDSRGQVINDFQASQTIKAVAENLRLMRVMRSKLDDLHGDYRLLPRQS